jgi:RNA polymerase sigma factor (TIGR02999 family)
MSSPDIGQILQEADSDPQALKELFTSFHKDLRKYAHGILAAHDNPSLNTAGLISELFIKLMDSSAPLTLQSERHFLATASRTMRQIMVDHARHRLYQKRDRRQEVSLNDELVHPEASGLLDCIALDQALDRLQAEDPKLAQVVELHFFVGLSFEEIAKIQDVSLSTVERNWKLARIILYRNMK